MRTALLSATCLLSLCASALAGPLTKVETAELMAWQARSVFEHDNSAGEKARIAKHAANVKKTHDSLFLKLRDKGWREFPFDPIPEDESTTSGFSYVFMTHLASKHGYLVGVTYYEGLDYLWIDDRNGQMTMFCCSAPIFSSDGERMLILGSTMEGDQSEYTRLYKLQDYRLILDKKWLVPSESAGDLEFISWIADKVRLKRQYANPGEDQPFTFRLSTGTVE